MSNSITHNGRVRRYDVPTPATRATPTGRKDVALYDQLVHIDPSPVVALNRAVAVAEVDGPEVALAVVDRLAVRLTDYRAFHATRADLLRRLGRSAEARSAYEAAIAVGGNVAETAYLTRRRAQLAPPLLIPVARLLLLHLRSGLDVVDDLRDVIDGCLARLAH